DEAATLRGIIEHIFGFDLNPLAVLTARVNYLIAISDLLATHSDVEIPIYQADAVYAPTINTTGGKPVSTRTYQVGTRVQAIDLELPEELIQQSRLFGRVLEIMERTVRQRDSEAIFLATLEAEPAYASQPARNIWEPLLCDMFQKVHKLEE